MPGAYGEKEPTATARISPEKRVEEGRDRELERVVKPEPGNSVTVVRILRLLYSRGIARFQA